MGLEDDEGRLAEELQGKRLICEVGVSQEDVSVWRKGIIQCHLLAWNLYPSISAIITVNTGIFEYCHGDFWSAFPGLDSAVDQSQWGQHFKRFLENHASLETFQNLPGLAYVAPILAHGGVPQYCLVDFFVLLSKYGDPEQPSSEFIDFLGLHKNVMVNIDKPVQRFLLHGGEVAEEFVARCLALFQSRKQDDGGGTHGLPERVAIDFFPKWYAEHGSTQRQHIHRFPKPEIRIQPGDLWIYLRLPRSDDHPEIGPDACWEVDGKPWAVSRNHEIPLTFSDCWTVKCKDHEVNLQGISNNEPAMFFDSLSGKMIPNPRLRRLPEHLWAVFSQSASVEPEPSFREGIPTWPRYDIAVFNLEGQRHLKIGDHQFEVRRPFFHIEQDPVVIGVTSAEGLPIFHLPPKIDWEGKANFSQTRHVHNEGNIDISSDEFHMWFDEPGEYEFILRGPFGQNVHKRFVLIPGLNINLQPEVMWPNTPWTKCEVSAEQVDIRSMGGDLPPFIIHDHSFHFQVMFEDTNTVINLIVEALRLRWRVIMSSEEVFEWGIKPISLSVDQLEQADYPRLICEMGETANEVDVSLIGKHGAIQPPQGQRSVVSQKNNIWAFDLRMVRDQVRQSGLAEEFDIRVKGLDGVQLYNGTVFAVQPYWNLQEFQVKWKKQDEGHVIRVTWREKGNTITGRWLILIPLWRPWEVVIQVHQLGEEEKMSFEWHPPDIRPGRYMVRAVHAPWDCEDWCKAQYVAQKIIDINMECLADTFEVNDDYETTIESYFERLLAHWYRPQQLENPPPIPLALTSGQIGQFLECLEKTSILTPLQIPRDGSGALSIFCLNPDATTNAVSSSRVFPDIWGRVLPSREIIFLRPGDKDKAFIYEVAFQYTVLGTAAKPVKLKHKRKYLASPLQEWHRLLHKNKPPPDDVIFLCEKFALFAGRGVHVKREYDELKHIYQRREAV